MPPDEPEELDLHGSAPLPTKPKSGDANVEPPVEHNHIHTSVPDLRDVVTPGQTNEEFVNNLLTLPDDRLIPWEECWLPSQGRFYGWPDGLVQVRAMGQTAEKILGTQRLAQSGQSIDYLFRECVRFPNGFDPLDLLLGDRVFLLYYLRGITHGHNYEFVVTCPNSNCEAVTQHVYDLNDLAATMVTAKPGVVEPAKVVLPFISQATGREVWVGVRFLRASDANAMLAQRKARKKLMAQPGGGVKTRQPRSMSQMRGGGGGAADPRGQQVQNQQLDDTINQNLEKIIVNVMGTGDIFMIRQFITKMHAQDSAAIREWLRENTPGIDNTVSLECPECNNTFTMELPISESFFRPSKS